MKMNRMLNKLYPPKHWLKIRNEIVGDWARGERGIDIMERDIQLLKMCIEQKFLTLRQIGAMFFQESENIYRSPAKRVCLLRAVGLLKSIKPRTTHCVLYLTTRAGAKLLKLAESSEGLSALCDLNYSTYFHDLTVTNIRIIFAHAFGLTDWTCKRLLQKRDPHGIFPDGIVRSDDRRFFIEFERSPKNRSYYLKLFAKFQAYPEKPAAILYLVEKESTKNWLMGLAKDMNLGAAYFLTLNDFLYAGTRVKFLNKNGEEFVLERKQHPLI